jgi:hypothetical protein
MIKACNTTKNHNVWCDEYLGPSLGQAQQPVIGFVIFLFGFYSIELP